MFALRKRRGSRLFAVYLRYSYNSFTAYGQRKLKKEDDLSFELSIADEHLEMKKFARKYTQLF